MLSIVKWPSNATRRVTVPHHPVFEFHSRRPTWRGRTSATAAAPGTRPSDTRHPPHPRGHSAPQGRAPSGRPGAGVPRPALGSADDGSGVAWTAAAAAGGLGAWPVLDDVPPAGAGAPPGLDRRHSAVSKSQQTRDAKENIATVKVVYLSICILVTTASPAKMAEGIKMPLDGKTSTGRKKPYIT